MKYSIKHLPKSTQEELRTLLELILHYVPKCSMVVLYGSYARGGYVLWDERVEFGVHTSYQSDYDLMVVVDKTSTNHVENKIREKLLPKYHSIFSARRHASPQIIVEPIDRLNNELERRQYFFTEIVKEGIKIYDKKEHRLAKPRQLSFKEIKQFAVEEFQQCYPFANGLLNFGSIALGNNQCELGSFQAHQACERYYYAISLVFTNYRPKCHKLNELHAQVKEFSRDLSAVFPQNNEFEKRCYDLLCRAYIEARYNKKFVVTKEELIYMLERIELLKEITNRICTEKINSYDALIEGEKTLLNL